MFSKREYIKGFGKVALLVGVFTLSITVVSARRTAKRILGCENWEEKKVVK
jgi:hypothetical protein